MSSLEPGGDLQRLSCGCVMGVRDDAFLIEPCDLDCPVYRYVREQLAAQEKPVTMATFDDEPRIRDVLTPDPDMSRLAGFPVYPVYEVMSTPEGSVTLTHPAYDVVMGIVRDGLEAERDDG